MSQSLPNLNENLSLIENVSFLYRHSSRFCSGLEGRELFALAAKAGQIPSTTMALLAAVGVNANDGPIDVTVPLLFAPRAHGSLAAGKAKVDYDGAIPLELLGTDARLTFGLHTLTGTTYDGWTFVGTVEVVADVLETDRILTHARYEVVRDVAVEDPKRLTGTGRLCQLVLCGETFAQSTKATGLEKTVKSLSVQIDGAVFIENMTPAARDCVGMFRDDAPSLSITNPGGAQIDGMTLIGLQDGQSVSDSPEVRTEVLVRGHGANSGADGGRVILQLRALPVRASEVKAALLDQNVVASPSSFALRGDKQSLVQRGLSTEHQMAGLAAEVQV